MGKNIGEFGELMGNCQSFIPQIYVMFNICSFSFVGHLPKFSTPNNLNSWFCQCFLPPVFSTTVVREIFIRDNLVIKFICCVIFSWIGCTYKISDSQILFALNNFYMCTLFTIQQLPEVWLWPRSWQRKLMGACVYLLC